MNRNRRYFKLVIDRKAGFILVAAVAVVGTAGVLSSQQLTMSATYPIPAGVYNQIVTTGNSGTAAADTTLNRNAGNTVLIPASNTTGKVGIGTSSPAVALHVVGNASTPNADIGLTKGANTWTMSTIAGSGAWILNPGFGTPTIVANRGGSLDIGSSMNVRGSVKVGDDASACNAPGSGTQRWHGGAMQVCNGTSWVGIGAAAVLGSFTTQAQSGCGASNPCPTPNTQTGSCSCPSGASAVLTGQSPGQICNQCGGGTMCRYTGTSYYYTCQ